MEFKIEDFLKNIFPGILIIFGVYFISIPKIEDIVQNPFNASWKDNTAFLLVVFLSIAYFVGFVNEIISNWLEDYLLFKISQKPIMKLFSGKSNTIKLFDEVKVFNELKGRISELPEEYKNLDKSKAEKIFQFVKSYFDFNSTEATFKKTITLYRAYNFSRNMILPIFISGLLVSIKFFILTQINYALLNLLITIALIFLFYFRWSERGLYYSRSLLMFYFYSNGAKPGVGLDV